MYGTPYLMAKQTIKALRAVGIGQLARRVACGSGGERKVAREVQAGDANIPTTSGKSERQVKISFEPRQIG